MFRGLAKRLPHPLLLRVHQRYQILSQSALARKISRRTGLPLLETLPLSPLKTSDTVFVLGSGSSINEISPERWNIIGGHDTIAMNYWPVHPFVPKIYLFEDVRLDEGYDSIFYTLRGLLDRRARDYHDCVKIVSELTDLHRRQIILDMPEAFRHRLYIGYSANIVARNERELVAGLRYMVRRGMFRQREHIGWQFKCAGSVLAALSLAVCMGYRRIILCGIDLKNADYFYQDSERYPESSQWEFVPRSSLHPAARRLPWLVPAQEVIVHFKKEVLDRAQIELFVENRSSALYPRVPEIPLHLLDQLAGSAKRDVSRQT